MISVVNGQPIINGKPATWDAKLAEDNPMEGVLSAWRCPECGAALAVKGFCLNACHLNAAQFQRFQSGLTQSRAKVDNEESAQ